MSTVTLNPSVLQWARSKAGLSESALAEQAGVTLDAVQKWEKTGAIQIKLVSIIADITRTAFGFLFLNEPPSPALPIADFRRVGNAHISGPSDNLLEIVYSAQLKQDWYREFMIEHGQEPVHFVGQASTSIPVKETANDIRRALNIGPVLTELATKWEDALRLTTEAAEDNGIIVLRSGHVGGDTSQTLDVNEFRGFALADEYAPLIFVNGSDSLGAQLFTMAHEIAHIWLGKTGVSNLERTYASGGSVETYCNSVAAEVLLPLEAIKLSWEGDVDDTSEISRLSDKYKVSRVVVARRARDAGLLTEERYTSYYRLVATRPKKPSGGSYYVNEKYQNSRLFSIAIIRDAIAGRTSQGEAMRFLGIKKESTFRKYASSLRAGMEWPTF